MKFIQSNILPFDDPRIQTFVLSYPSRLITMPVSVKFEMQNIFIWQLMNLDLLKLSLDMCFDLWTLIFTVLYICWCLIRSFLLMHCCLTLLFAVLYSWKAICCLVPEFLHSNIVDEPCEVENDEGDLFFRVILLQLDPSKVTLSSHYRFITTPLLT